MNGGEFVDAKRLADYLAAIAKVWATSDDEKRHPARVLRPLWKALGGAGPDRQRKRRPRPAARPEPPPPPPPEARDPPPPAPSAPAYRMYADAAAPFCINPETVVVGSPVAFCRRAHLPEVALSPRAFEHHHNQQPSPANRRFDTDPSVRYQLPPDNPLYVPPPGAPVVATHRIVTCKVNEIGVVHLHPPKPPAGKSRCPLGVVAEPEPKAPSANIEMVMAERAGIRPKSGAAAAFDWDRWEKKKNFAGSTVTSMRLLRRREAARLRRERRAAKRSLHERYHGLMQSASADWRDLYDFVENATQHQAISDSLAAVGPFVGDPVV
ncbi:hypothetical protein DIPPA_10700 [Diplonema papillatum]|nr:hypothetical protein DIPPA_10700 [Diplonema papillatum]